MGFEPTTSRTTTKSTSRRGRWWRTYSQLRGTTTATITAYCRIWPHLPTPARSHSALGGQFPAITSLAQLERHHIEAFLTWNRTRTWRGRVARDQRVSAAAVHGAVLTVRNFLDDVTLWGWADRPQRRLLPLRQHLRDRRIQNARADQLSELGQGGVVTLAAVDHPDQVLRCTIVTTTPRIPYGI